MKHSTRCDFSSAPSAANSTTPSVGYPTPVQDFNNHIAITQEDALSPRAGNSNSHNAVAPQPQDIPAPITDGPTIIPATYGNGGNRTSLNLQHLELFHNYTTTIIPTISPNPLMRTVWRNTVTGLAFSHAFVMRAILAISALHLSRFRPDQASAYLATAIAEHQLSLREATEILQGGVTKENCDAVYMFSALTCHYAWASPRRPGDFLIVDDSGRIAEWLVLFRGMRTIVESAQAHLLAGPLGPIFRNGLNRIAHGGKAGEEAREPHLEELRQLLASSDPDTRAVYEEALDQLALCFVRMLRLQAPESPDVFVWLYQLSEEYLRLLSRRTPEALAIFAHFCVLLKRLDGFWWMQGWAHHLLAQVWELLAEEHRLWVQWACEEVGWVPPA